MRSGYAHAVYKNALNEFSFGCGCPTRGLCGNLAVRRISLRWIPTLTLGMTWEK